MAVNVFVQSSRKKKEDQDFQECFDIKSACMSYEEIRKQ